MTIRKIISALFAICLLTVCLCSGVHAQEETVPKQYLSTGENLEILIEGQEGNYHSDFKTFYFIPEVTDWYSFSVTYNEEQHINHNLQMTVNTADGRIYDHKNLVFQAEAGVEYAIEVDFWGNYDKDARYLFSLQSCVSGEHFQLVAEPDSGFQGSFLYVYVQWDAANCRPEELTWSSSDEAVATVAQGGPRSAKVILNSMGRTTITATNAAGFFASVDVMVLEGLDVITLDLQSPQSLTLPASGTAQIQFTPIQTGYYALTADNGFFAWFEEAEVTLQDTRMLYHLQAGVTYEGYVENTAETMAVGTVNLQMSELRMVTAMEITRLPNNTTYLASGLEQLWTYQVLAGMQMQITWSDGTTELWSFDREGPYIGAEDLRWEICSGEEQTVIQLHCGQAETSFALTVQDLKVIGIRLKDASPLQIAENSCGIWLEEGNWYYVPYQAALREVEILLSDGTFVTAKANEMVYGNMVMLEEFQSDNPWTMGGEQNLRFSYLDFETFLPVEIVESLVERIELTQLPVDTFLLGDETFFAGTKGRYFFAPEDLREVLKGMELTIYYRNGNTAVVTDAGLDWVWIEDKLWPFYDGYPLGMFSQVYADQYPVSKPGEYEGLIEFMGARAVYTMHFVNELPKPPVEPVPPTGDVSLSPMRMLLGMLTCVGALMSKKKYQ